MGKFDPKVRLENVVYAVLILLMVVFCVLGPRQMVRHVDKKLDMDEIGMQLAASIADMNFDAGQHSLLQITTKDFSVPENLPENWHGKVTLLSVEPFYEGTTISPRQLEFIKVFVERYNSSILCRQSKD